MVATIVRAYKMVVSFWLKQNHRKEDVKGSIATTEKIYIATYILGTGYEVAVCL